MAYQAKQYKKFVATAATATLVASAFAPFASAHSFSDVEEKYSEAVDFLVSKGVNGYADGTFQTQKTITRLEAAEMLAKALGLTEVTDAPESGFTDVPARVATLINAFKAEGITSGKTETTFGSNDLITRGELAIWIQRAYDLVAEEGSTNDFTDVADRYKEAVQALVDNGITQGTSETTFGTTANAKRGDYALFIKRAADAAVVEEVAIESVSAINPTTAEVTFTKAVESLEKEAVVVTQEGTKVYVKSVTLNEDKTKATVEFYNTLTSGKKYDVAITVGEETLKDSFTYEVGAIEKVVVENQAIPAGKSTAIEYKVLDENGLDITTLATVTFQSDKSVTNDGSVTLADKETAFVVVTATYNGVTKSSERFAVTGEAAKAVALSNYTFDTEEPTWTSTSYKQITELALNNKGAKLFVEFKNQFGKVEDTDGKVRYESLDTTVAIVDAVTGEVTPRTVGKAPVKVSVYNGSTVEYSTVVELSVLPASEAKEITSEDAELTINVSVGQQASTAVKVVDQYGGTVSSSTISATSDNNNVFAYVSNGVLYANVVAGVESATANIKLTSGTLTKVIPVKVVKAGAIVGYEVKGAKTTLDLNTSTIATDANYQADQMAVTVVGVDANGLETSAGQNFTYEIKDSKGNTVEKVTTGVSELEIEADELTVGETYTVTAAVNSLPIGTFTFNVVDTRKAPAVSFKSNELTVTTANELLASNLTTSNFEDLLENIMELDGSTVTDVKFNTNNATILADNGEGAITLGTVETSSTVSVYIDELTVTKDSQTFTIKTNEVVNVTIDNKAPELSVPSNVAISTTKDGVSTIKLTVGLSEAAHYLYENKVIKMTAGSGNEGTEYRLNFNPSTNAVVTDAKLSTDLKSFEITLEAGELEAGDVITVAFTNPTEVPLVDAQGNKLANATYQIKVNNGVTTATVTEVK